MGGKDKVPKEWFNNKEKGSLDYKMRISHPDFKSNKLEKKNNIRIISDNTENSILYKSDILLSILVYNVELKQKIDESIKLFFILTNFGKRQNKGFGCFYIADTKWHEIINYLNGYNWYLLNENTFGLLKFNNTPYKNNYSFYLIVSDKWRKLKSGFNYGGIYIKSSVFKYLCNNNLRWDKRWLKKELKPIIAPNHLKAKFNKNSGRHNAPNDCGNIKNNNYDCENPPNFQNWNDNRNFKETYRFGRAMLGLAEHYEFKSSNNKITYQVQVKSDEVERYKSPVTFKVFIDNDKDHDKDNKIENIYAIANDQLLYNQNFHFRLNVKEDNKIKHSVEIKDGARNWKILQTPRDANEWDLINFLDIFFPCVGFQKQ